MKALNKFVFLFISLIWSEAVFAQIPDCNSGSAYGTKEFLMDYGNLACANNVYAYDASDLSTGKTNFSQNFRYSTDGTPGSLVTVNNPVVSLNISDIGRMFNDIVASGNFFPQNSDHSALAIHYGIDLSSGQPIMILFFEPVILKLITGSNNNNNYKFYNTGKLYRIVGGTFQLTNATDTQNLTKNYHNIYQKYATGVFQPFNFSANFIDGDTRFTTISIQQISQMYCDNQATVINPVQINLINFNIIADNHYNDQNGQPVADYKLHVVASYNNTTLGTNVSNSNYLNCGADFTQMCPPNCSSLWINYYEQNPNQICTAQNDGMTRLKNGDSLNKRTKQTTEHTDDLKTLKNQNEN
jgi:hypothetical protein